MARSMNKKRKKQPFDEIAAEKFSLPADCDKNFNNSYYLAVCGDKLSAYMRLGYRGDGKTEMWVNVCGDNFSFTNETHIYGGGCPLTFEMKEAKRVWLCKFDGELTDGDKKVNCRLDFEFTATSPIYDFFTHGDDNLTAQAYAGKKWNKEFFAGLAKNSQTHYEQYGAVSGAADVGGNLFELTDATAIRDHSFGMRDWAFMNNHVWLAGVSKSGKAFNVSTVFYPNADGIRAGNFFDKITVEKFVNLSFDGEYALGNVPASITATAKLSNKKTVIIKGEQLGGYNLFEMQDGAYKMHESYGKFVIDGEEYYGIWEFGYNKNPEVWAKL